MTTATTSDLSQYGPWALIAGGSEGVGAAFAHRLAAAGLHLVLVARSEGPLQATAEAVRRHGGEVETVAADLLAPDALARLRAVTDGKEVGLLVYNAGANTYGHDVVTGDLGQLRAVLDLNVTRQLELTHHYGARMRERGRGGILLVGSLAGYVGVPELAVYAAAKAFARVFAEGLWLELRPYGVHVLHLVLGATRTPAMERAGLRFDLPGLRVDEPDEVAAAGLEHLADGPVRVMPRSERLVIHRSGPDRAALVQQAHEGHQRLIGG
jgi:short-subunit dehydrogenase